MGAVLIVQLRKLAGECFYFLPLCTVGLLSLEKQWSGWWCIIPKHVPGLNQVISRITQNLKITSASCLLRIDFVSCSFWYYFTIPDHLQTFLFWDYPIVSSDQEGPFFRIVRLSCYWVAIFMYDEDIFFHILVRNSGTSLQIIFGREDFICYCWIKLQFAFVLIHGGTCCLLPSKELVPLVKLSSSY